MLLIPIHALKPGMSLAQPVHHPLCRQCVLLTRDTVLQPKYIKRLEELAVTHAWIDFPGFDEVDRKVNTDISLDHMRLFEVLNNSVNRLEQRVDVQINLTLYTRAVRNMLADIVADGGHEVLTHQLASCRSTLPGHSANCCYLALLIGAHMTGYLRNERATLPAKLAENTSELGIGALLHDIGKLQMPDDLQDKCILDPEAQWREYQFHVRSGYEQARDHVSVVAANIILNHHQRYDGAGFPARESRDGTRPARPLAERQIHIFARIVSVVEVFDHLLCPGGVPVPTIRAIHALRSRGFRGWFDPVVVETLLRLVPAFQLGSVVTLSNGDEAAVVRNHPEAPCRPLVRILQGRVGEDKIVATDRQLDLRMCRNASIVAVDGADVRPYIFSGELEPAL
jgi:HD-GYP domain-containing protein (c-di-GMP phosphodiesterase class II)